MNRAHDCTYLQLALEIRQRHINTPAPSSIIPKEHLDIIVRIVRPILHAHAQKWRVGPISGDTQLESG